MRKLFAMMVLGVALLAVTPAAEAHWRGGFRGGGVVVRPFVGFGFGYPYWGGYYGGYPYAYPYAYYPPVVYTAPPPATYAPPPAVEHAPAAPDIQREVLYPHGKYLLEGDGVNTAYRWTWIPSATPPPPPPVVEPAAPSSEPERPKQ